MLVVSPIMQFAQTVNNNHIVIEVAEINNPDLRYCTLSALANDNNLIYTVDEENNSVIVTSANDWSESQLQIYYDRMRATIDNDFTTYQMADKETQGATFVSWKESLPRDLFVLLFRLMLIENQDRSRTNQTCATSDPFCTTDIVSFHIDANPGTVCESGPDYGCMTAYTQRPPYWFHMKIAVAGTFTIRITNTNNNDLDFCAWGPFTDPHTPCPNQLTSDKIIDCDSPYNSVQECTIPSSSQVGQYYIMVITKYSSGATDVSFSKVAGSGPGETDCGILPGIASNDGPYCVGETIHLSVNAQDGATYSWSGPGGFTSNQQNPNRPNCTMNMAGTYTCVTTVGNQSVTATTEVIVYPMPTANFNYTSVCRGTPTQFTSTSTTNPSGQQIESYQWNFGDGQSGTGQSVTHTYANAGNYSVTLTTSCGNGHCTSTKTQTVPVYAAPVASASASPTTVIYGGTSTLTASAGTTGSFNFQWEPANMVVNPNSQTTQTVPLQATQTYTVTVTNPQGGCSSTAQVTVSMEGSNMTAMASADQYELCEGESTTLHAQPSGGTGSYTYSWTPANTLNNASIQNPVATPPVGSTTYTCSISDGITSQNVTVTIVVHPTMETDIYHTICENNTYTFFGEVLQTPGVYEHTVQTQHGCDSVIHLHLDNWDIYETPITRHFCQGDSYDFFGNQLSTSGTYYHTLQSIHGCDSVIRLNLIQDPIYEQTYQESTCEGGLGYFYNGDYLQPSNTAYTYVYETVLGCDSIIHLYINEAEYNSKTYNVSLCATQYTWASNGQTYYETGTYYDTLQFAGSCDSTLVLNLELRPSYDIDVVATSCDSYHWQNDSYNVDMTFDHSTTYTHHYTNSYGCESEVTLYLTIDNHNETEFTVSDAENCDSYFWDPMGHEIVSTDHPDWEYDMSGTYHRTYKNVADCDSIVTMHVQLEYTPQPSEIYPVDANNTLPHWVITATEFQINSYDFSIWEAGHPGTCHWDSITWTFEDPRVQWLLETDQTTTPPGKICKLYVLNHIEDTVWIAATVYNRCSPEGQSQRYWFICSFYDVDEQTESHGDFSVVPNPNNGTMTLSFEKLTGSIDLKVYDMTGNLIDHLNTYSIGGPEHMQYNMKHHAEGIYFFVATGKEGTIAKKVVVRR